MKCMWAVSHSTGCSNGYRLNWQRTAPAHLAVGTNEIALESRGAQFNEPGGNFAMIIVRRISAVLLLTVSVAFASAEPVAAVYKAKCALCHGAAGDGNTPAG